MKQYINFCLEMKGAYDEYPFGPEAQVMKVEGKMFALFSDERNSISLKCDPVIAENLREQHAAVIPGYHMNKKHWNTVLLDGSLEPEEVESMIIHSYELVVKSLPKAIRESLSGN
ncbi:Predicted DNA-binding protein, MmcQ/YjbR family [Paenibacillus algorifonticola]|uniref:Predicted DNA-binding protein, MmcQ/YjbR family n=1 Tax=Paenibacillus algorifonticola TaxID=684063 RepID=A0A1I2DQE6_9BACL|nr:MmcQ/YjbR family DNA-binding protein [Paenibacillus algorifonticola]SFE82707.1 Predicted DNA-binding protein, MmcQ/YjbR family [Paenibacillus algorifonticola]